MTFRRNTPWVVFKESGELVCKRCGECCYPSGETYIEVKLAGDRFEMKHKSCKPKPAAAKVKA